MCAPRITNTLPCKNILVAQGGPTLGIFQVVPKTTIPLVSPKTTNFGHQKKLPTLVHQEFYQPLVYQRKLPQILVAYYVAKNPGRISGKAYHESYPY